MSLVDYASSSDDDVPEDEENREEEKSRNETQIPKQGPSSFSTIPRDTLTSGPRVNQQPENASNTSAPSFLKLPDASLLLNSPTVSLLTGTDHASRVAVAMAESASRKRDSNELPSVLTRSKVPKGSLRNTKTVPDTGGGMLVPPQLTGRSNIVTEDIGKLFVRKKVEPSAE
ncbi:uncharacterized protein [Euphorbia lathyris]|uniref:uncharacterized protein n=1 Tax=Euphorbia lathyris TaxID=212925 RepID=UPI003313B64C